MRDVDVCKVCGGTMMECPADRYYAVIHGRPEVLQREAGYELLVLDHVEARRMHKHYGIPVNVRTVAVRTTAVIESNTGFAFEAIAKLNEFADLYRHKKDGAFFTGDSVTMHFECNDVFSVRVWISLNDRRVTVRVHNGKDALDRSIRFAFVDAGELTTMLNRMRPYIEQIERMPTRLRSAPEVGGLI